MAIDAGPGHRLATQLRLWRERALLTQEELARTTGLGVRTIRRLESPHNRRRPRSESIRLLVKGLNLTEEEKAQLLAPERVQPRAGPGPRQLPRDLPGFVGRERELAVLAEQHRGLLVVSGMAGVGKTALVVHWAHRAAAAFPDGTLYVNLRGFDPECPPLEPEAVLPAFLLAIGEPRHRIALDPLAQAALFRSALAEKRILMVLDNASSARQVRALLPAAPAAMVVVTSRDRLAGLVATDGARPLTLQPLAARPARQLLAARIGHRRVAAQAHAVNNIATVCAGLPLALAIAAARAADPSLSLGELADQLLRNGRRLDALTLDGDDATDVRAVFSWSYRQVAAPAARMFRLLAVHPAAGITVAAAASAGAVPLPRAEVLLRELTSVHLLEETATGRYLMHDLLRLFAREQNSPAEAQEAMARLASHFLHSALAANRTLHPTRKVADAGPPEPGTAVCGFADAAQARRWLLAESPTLLAMAQLLGGNGQHRHGWQLARELSAFLRRQGLWQECLVAQRVAQRCAHDLGDDLMQAQAASGLARLYLRQMDAVTAQHLLRQAKIHAERCGDPKVLADVWLQLSFLHEEHGDDLASATSHAWRAFDLYTEAGDETGQARALKAIGWQRLLAGDYEEALAHCGRALELFAALDSTSGLYAATLHNIGHACHRLGQTDKAKHCYGQALKLLRAGGDHWLTVQALTWQGAMFEELGEIGEARQAWQEALRLAEDFDGDAAQRLRAKLSGARRQSRTSAVAVTRRVL